MPRRRLQVKTWRQENFKTKVLHKRWMKGWKTILEIANQGSPLDLTTLTLKSHEKTSRWEKRTRIYTGSITWCLGTGFWEFAVQWCPKTDLQTVSNMTFLPSASDQPRQRYNYIVLISRILVEYFDSLQPLNNACIQHMPHKYTEEMSKKSLKVINKQIACINENACLFLFVCSIIFLKQYIYYCTDLHFFFLIFLFGLSNIKLSIDWPVNWKNNFTINSWFF